MKLSQTGVMQHGSTKRTRMQSPERIIYERDILRDFLVEALAPLVEREGIFALSEIIPNINRALSKVKMSTKDEAYEAPFGFAEMARLQSAIRDYIPLKQRPLVNQAFQQVLEDKYQTATIPNQYHRKLLSDALDEEPEADSHAGKVRNASEAPGTHKHIR
jgi:hypothetical protein